MKKRLAIVLALTCASPALAGPLCVNGHPAKRSPYVTYGGLKARPSYERDHFIPLCLGGADIRVPFPFSPPGPLNPGNVWYQKYPYPAKDKNSDEWRLCEAYCRGDLDLLTARAIIQQEWQRR